MLRLFILLLGLSSLQAFAIPCQCEVMFFAPSTASHKQKPTSFKNYDLEGFDSYKVKNQYACRESCLKEFTTDMPTERVNALLVQYSKAMIDERVLGYNCTGLSTYKYPVRVKASLGRLPLGNVADQIFVINHEEVCF